MASLISVILLAGGQGSRMGGVSPKQFLHLGDKRVALHSFELFLSLPQIKEIIVVCPLEFRHFFASTSPCSIHFADPGHRRQDSVFNGLKLISSSTDFVCIHDSARPFLTKERLLAVLQAAENYGAAALAIPARNTIKECSDQQLVIRTLPRAHLWEMHTPQVAKPHLLLQGYALAQNATVTDDCSLIELTGHPIKIVEDSPHNIKLTTPEDWLVAEKLAEEKREEEIRC